MTAATPALDLKTVQDGAQLISYAPDDALVLDYPTFAQGWVDTYNATAADPDVELPTFRLVATAPKPMLAEGDVTAAEFVIAHVASEGDIETSMVLVKSIDGRYIRVTCRPATREELDLCSIPAPATA